MILIKSVPLQKAILKQGEVTESLKMKLFVRWIVLMFSFGIIQGGVLRDDELFNSLWMAPNWPPVSNPSTIQTTSTEGITSTPEYLTSTTMASTTIIPDSTTVDIDKTDNLDSTTVIIATTTDNPVSSSIQEEIATEENSDLPISPTTTESPISNPSTQPTTTSLPPNVIPTLPPRTIQIKGNNFGDITTLKMLLNLKLDNQVNWNIINVIGILRNATK